MPTNRRPLWAVALALAAPSCATSEDAAPALVCDASTCGDAEPDAPGFGTGDAGPDAANMEILQPGAAKWRVGPMDGVNEMVLGNTFAYVAGSVSFSKPEGFYEADLTPDAGTVKTLLSMATPQQHPYSIASDGTFIYAAYGTNPPIAPIVQLGVNQTLAPGAADMAIWSDKVDYAASPGLREVQLDGGGAKTLSGDAVIRLTADAQGVYWVSANNTVGAYDRASGTTVTAAFGNNVGSVGRPVRLGGYLYLAGGGTIFRWPVTGGAPETIATLSAGVESGNNIAVDSKYVYTIGTIATPPVHFRLIRVPVAGGPEEILDDQLGYGRSLQARPGLLVYVGGSSLWAYGALKPSPQTPDAGPPRIR